MRPWRPILNIENRGISAFLPLARLKCINRSNEKGPALASDSTQLETRLEGLAERLAMSREVSI